MYYFRLNDSFALEKDILKTYISPYFEQFTINICEQYSNFFKKKEKTKAKIKDRNYFRNKFTCVDIFFGFKNYMCFWYVSFSLLYLFRIRPIFQYLCNIRAYLFMRAVIKGTQEILVFFFFLPRGNILLPFCYKMLHFISFYKQFSFSCMFNCSYVSIVYCVRMCKMIVFFNCVLYTSEC